MNFNVSFQSRVTDASRLKILEKTKMIFVLLRIDFHICRGDQYTLFCEKNCLQRNTSKVWRQRKFTKL